MPDRGKLVSMSGKQLESGGHFGRQMRKERLAHGWSLPELSQRTGVRRRPPEPGRERQAPADGSAGGGLRCRVHRAAGWFTDWYQESRSWSEVPAGFRSWSELEDKAARLCDWMPGTSQPACSSLRTTRARILGDLPRRHRGDDSQPPRRPGRTAAAACSPARTHRR